MTITTKEILLSEIVNRPSGQSEISLIQFTSNCGNCWHVKTSRMSDDKMIIARIYSDKWRALMDYTARVGVLVATEKTEDHEPITDIRVLPALFVIDQMAQDQTVKLPTDRKREIDAAIYLANAKGKRFNTVKSRNSFFITRNV